MTSNTLRRFVKYGQLANARERQKIADWIADWQPIPPQQANIDARYVHVINAFIEDSKISALWNEQSSVQEDLMKELIQLLEQVAKVDIKVDEQEQQLQQQFKTTKKGIDEDITIINKSQHTPTQPWETEYRDAVQAAIQGEEEQLLELYADLKEEMLGAWQSAKEQDNNASKEVQAEESKLLADFEALTSKQFRDLPLKNPFGDFLRNRYSKAAFDLVAFRKKRRQLRRERPLYQRPLLQKTQENIARKWQQAIDEAQIKRELAQIDQLRQAALKKLYEKIEAIEALLRQLEPFLGSDGVPGRLWDLSTGSWKRVDMRTLQEYAQLLEQRKDLAALADMLGRFRQAEATFEMEHFEETIYYQQETIDYAGASELVGVVESDELSRLLPSELALFSDEVTESIFYKRFLEKRLQTFEYIARASQEKSEQQERQREKKVESDKGPFILAVDTSGSMHGEPEFIAKVLAFAISKIALREQRKAYLISFSTTIETLDLSQLQQALPALIGFLQMSFHGGTDAAPAVQQAIQQMKTEHYQKADLLLVSDGIFSRLPDKIQHEIEQLKQAENRFHALMIGSSYHEQALEFCDQVWQYNPRHDQVVDLVRVMQESLTRMPHTR